MRTLCRQEYSLALYVLRAKQIDGRGLWAHRHEYRVKLLQITGSGTAVSAFPVSMDCNAGRDKQRAAYYPIPDNESGAPFAERYCQQTLERLQVRGLRQVLSGIACIEHELRIVRNETVVDGGVVCDDHNTVRLRNAFCRQRIRFVFALANIDCLHVRIVERDICASRGQQFDNVQGW